MTQMTLPLFADVEGAMRSWLRAHPLLTSSVAGRVYFGVPEGSPTMPLVTVERIGGAPQFGEVPLEDARLSFTIWASNKKVATDVVRGVVQSLHQMDNDRLDAETVGYGAVVDSVLWTPDPETRLPRYVVDATVTAKAG